ncbi:hypothetical protein FNV43_RR04791 [Rhamnella rubrinervis]|uniref:CRC domain-containing protein n=1 Tax=Rhamnella rubrinervis TaxID=2594499 RepID=A0A8K0HLF9_9ROSA|nr:hypothetical protein FNV43_RR04791 [Rhamnella rubrinervis]
MDTPVKNQLSPATPFSSKFEDSPVFNYISNLSPIEPVKFRHNDHTFNPITFTSSPSVFASPKISSFCETRFSIRRHHFSDQPKPDSLRSENENFKSEGISVSVHPSDLCTEQLGYSSSASSAREITSELLTENLELAIEFPSTLKYDSGSPNSNVLPCDVIKTDSVLETESIQIQDMQSVTENSKEKHCLFERESFLRRICWVEKNDGVARCYWAKQISDSDNLLNFDSSITGGHFEGKDPKMVDAGTMSFISDVLEDDLKKFEKPESSYPIGTCEQCVMGESCTQSERTGDQEETDQMPAALSRTLMDKLVVTDSCNIVDDKRIKFIRSSCKLRSQLHRRIRRRCLDFERAGSHEMKSTSARNDSSAVSVKSSGKVASVENNFFKIKNDCSCSSSNLPGVGLHLNALATTIEGKEFQNESLAHESQLISTPRSIISSCSLMPDEISHDKFSSQKSIERDSVLYSNEAQAAEDAHHTPKCVIGEEFDHSSPQNKRSNPEHVTEMLACKRCNCKRSKCLKLYCECFAAGLYCVGPCSCQDCLNNPINEDTVLETRRQIESRDPLAFAPKVIRSSDAVAECRDENNTTPASARHKRGCNCRKSSCLKKYCECYQGGVGCSMSCRCVACKNTYGRKDGDWLSGAEEAEFKESKDVETIRDPDFPKTPFEIGRPFDEPPLNSRGEPRSRKRSLPNTAGSSP